MSRDASCPASAALLSAVPPACCASPAPNRQTCIVIFSHWAVLRALTGRNFDNCDSSECTLADLLADLRVVDADVQSAPLQQEAE